MLRLTAVLLLLLRIEGVHRFSDEDLWRFVEGVFVVSSVLVAAVGLLLHLDLLDAAYSLSHVLRHAHLLELHLSAERRDELLEEGWVFLIESQAHELFLYSLGKTVSSLTRIKYTSCCFRTL